MLTRLNRPYVSIGLPVYNGERYLAEAIRALRVQTFEDIELIICDNASTDGTEEIGRAHAADDKRVRYVRNTTNMGAANNYCRTFELATGPYFRWATADDLSAPESVARCVEILDNEPSVVLAYPKTKLIDEHGEVISEYDDNLHLPSQSPSERFKQLMARLGLCNAVYGLMRRDVLSKTRLLGSYISSDNALLAELTLYGAFSEIAKFLFFRRMHPEAFSSQDIRQKLEFYNPNVKRTVTIVQARLLWENFRAVERAPLPMRERMRLRGHVIRMGIWDRHQVARELLGAVKQAIGGS